MHVTKSGGVNRVRRFIASVALLSGLVTDTLSTGSGGKVPASFLELANVSIPARNENRNRGFEDQPGSDSDNQSLSIIGGDDDDDNNNLSSDDDDDDDERSTLTAGNETSPNNSDPENFQTVCPSVHVTLLLLLWFFICLMHLTLVSSRLLLVYPLQKISHLLGCL